MTGYAGHPYCKHPQLVLGREASLCVVVGKITNQYDTKTRFISSSEVPCIFNQKFSFIGFFDG